VSVFGYNYPAGAEHDPSAPWNQPDDCELCGGDGVKALSELGPSAWGEDCFSEQDRIVTCPDCSGTGRQKTRAELRAEYEEDKADMARDNE
jgi:DnaJ-class molecular chaperone